MLPKNTNRVLLGDPPPEKEKDLVLLVSYPRSGVHWVKSIISLFSQRPCLNVSPYYTDQPPWGFHTHGHANYGNKNYPEPPNTYKSIVYLRRNDVGRVIYSLLSFEKKPISEEEIRNKLREILEHRQTWEPVSSVVIEYEKLVEQDFSQINQVIDLLGLDRDDDKLRDIIEFLTKERLASIYNNNKQNVVPIQDNYDKIYENHKEYIQKVIDDY
jgi:hypothetical protein